MKKKDKIEQVDVDGVTNFVASLNDDKKTIDRVYGDADSEINFLVEEVPVEDLSILDKFVYKLTGKTLSGKTLSDKNKPSLKIKELESDGVVNFVAAENGGGAFHKLDQVIGGRGSTFTFSQLQNLNNIVDRANVHGVANFNGNGAGNN